MGFLYQNKQKTAKYSLIPIKEEEVVNSLSENWSFLVRLSCGVNDNNNPDTEHPMIAMVNM